MVYYSRKQSARKQFAYEKWHLNCFSSIINFVTVRKLLKRSGFSQINHPPTSYLVCFMTKKGGNDEKQKKNSKSNKRKIKHN